MSSEIVMKHPSGVTKTAYQGFSFTALLFGLFVPLLRGDLKHVVIYLVVAVMMGAFTFGLLLPVLWIVYGVNYNKWHYEGLLLKGFVPTIQGMV